MNIEDLQKFCSKDGERFALSNPFNEGDFTYATDGRIIIRIPQIPGVTGHEKQPKNPSKIIPNADGFLPVEYPPNWETFEPSSSNCKYCKGSGKTKHCPDCDGAGEVECETCGHEENCNTCRGYGVIETKDENAADCVDCDGTGKIEETFALSLNRDAVWLNLSFIKKIHTLPNARIFYNPHDPHSCMYFEFDGGIGGIMPMRPSAADMTIKQWPALTPAL